MSLRKSTETKQQPSRARSGNKNRCCLVSSISCCANVTLASCKRDRGSNQHQFPQQVSTPSRSTATPAPGSPSRLTGCWACRSCPTSPRRRPGTRPSRACSPEGSTSTTGKRRRMTLRCSCCLRERPRRAWPSSARTRSNPLHRYRVRKL